MTFVKKSDSNFEKKDLLNIFLINSAAHYLPRNTEYKKIQKYIFFSFFVSFRELYKQTLFRQADILHRKIHNAHLIC